MVIAMPLHVIAMREPNEPTISRPRLLSSGRYVHFGPFRIDQQRQELTRDGAPLKLQGKVYQALLTLLEKPREVVTREELRMRLWPDDTHVNYDANVNTTVNKLRIALGDSSDNPLYIETIPRKGYCILVQPEVSNQDGILPAQNESSEGVTEGAAEGDAPLRGTFTLSKSDIWFVLGAIGLVLTGILIGAGIMRLWMNHTGALPI